MPKEANAVYVGRKPAMNYVLAVITSFNVPNTDEVVLKARGGAISRAEKLRSCGVSSVQDLANFDSRELSDKLQVSEKRVSKWIDEAKKALEH